MHTARRLLIVASLSAGLLVAPLAVSATAHVTVNAPGATQGGYTKMTFRMPTEKDVDTVGLEVAFPQDTPLASVRVKPKAGWSYEIVKGAPEQPLENHGEPVTEVVQRIVWTATGEGVGPTEFEEFEVSGGPLPETEQLVFPALQTYADGEVVRWIEEVVEGAEEPEKPAPVLALAPATEGGHGASSASASAAPAPETEVDSEPVSAESDAGGSSGTAIAALVVAGLALLAALGSLVTSRRRA